MLWIDFESDLNSIMQLGKTHWNQIWIDFESTLKLRAKPPGKQIWMEFKSCLNDICMNFKCFVVQSIVSKDSKSIEIPFKYALNRFWIWFELNHAACQVALESNLNRIWMKFKAVLGVGRTSNWRPFQNVFKSHLNKSLNGRAIVFNFCRGFYMKYECITNHSKILNATLKKFCKVFKWNLNLNGIWMRYEWIVNGKCFFEWNINGKQLFKWKLN